MLNFIKNFFRFSFLPLSPFGRTDTGKVRKNNEDSFSILPDYENRQNTVLIGLRNGKVVHLDSKLKVINSVSLFKSDKLKNSDTWRARTEIKGLLHTFYGEFIVVYYMERKSNFSGVRMDIGFHKHFIRNEQIGRLFNLNRIPKEHRVNIHYES